MIDDCHIGVAGCWFWANLSYWKKTCPNVKIESDSTIAAQYLKDGPPLNHPQRHILEEARRIVVGTSSTITHIFRQANQTADCLARLGSRLGEDLIVTRNFPLAVREFVITAALGVEHLGT